MSRERELVRIICQADRLANVMVHGHGHAATPAERCLMYHKNSISEGI